MNSPSPLMLQIASLSKGLDTTHPEYECLPQSELSEVLRSVIPQVFALEDLEHKQSITLHVVKDHILKLLENIDSGVDLKALRENAVDMLFVIEE